MNVLGSLDQVFRIQMESGQQFLFDTQPTLLSALEENDINIASSCRTGECGDCRIRLSKGQVLPLNQSTIVLSDNEILPCCCVPVSDLEIGYLRVLQSSISIKLAATRSRQ